MWFMIAFAALSAFSAIQQGKAQAQQARFRQQEALANAAQAKADAKESQRIGELEALETLAEEERRKGAARVARAAGGGASYTGTNWLLSVQDDDAAEWEIWKTGYTARRRTGRFQAESLGFTRQAGQYGVTARNVKRAGYLKAGTAILGGFSKASTMS